MTPPTGTGHELGRVDPKTLTAKQRRNGFTSRCAHDSAVSFACLRAHCHVQLIVPVCHVETGALLESNSFQVTASSKIRVHTAVWGSVAFLAWFPRNSKTKYSILRGKWQLANAVHGCFRRMTCESPSMSLKHQHVTRARVCNVASATRRKTQRRERAVPLAAGWDDPIHKGATGGVQRERGGCEDHNP
jgi:hypothetical protein